MKLFFVSLGAANMLAFFLGLLLESNWLIGFWFFSYPVLLALIVWTAVSGDLREWMR